MTQEYTIAAIPTLYRGRMYRSRLEARWAAFFDRLGWQYEYEPFDLGKWSPDFALTDPFDALIEVKPATEPDLDLFDRVQGASRNGGAVIVTRVAPVVVNNLVEVGWWAASYMPVVVVWVTERDRPAFRADFFSFTSGLESWVSGTIGHGPAEKLPTVWNYAEHTMGLWADASNAVQWEPKQ
jgi:hypothetical protein